MKTLFWLQTWLTLRALRISTRLGPNALGIQEMEPLATKVSGFAEQGTQECMLQTDCFLSVMPLYPPELLA